MIGESYIKREETDADKYMDFRSDVVSRAPQEMLQAMAKAETGDDVFEEDVTINKLQQRMAEYFGFEDALLTPSTTMGNLISVLLWTRPGDEVIIWGSSHSAQRESCGMAQIGGVQTRQILKPSGVLQLSEVASKVRKAEQHVTFPDTNLVFIQNPTFEGEVWPMEQLKILKQFGQKQSIKIHCDGARAFNAINFYGCEAKQLGKLYDSMSLCLSKGLCCPFGSVLFGNKAAIKQAKHLRKSLGGGLRQVGIIGAAGLYALDHGLEYARQDGKMAKLLGSKLSQIPNIALDQSTIHINMINFKIIKDPFDHQGFKQYMKDHNIIIKGINIEKGSYRVMTHRVIREKEVQIFVQTVKKYMEERNQ